MDGSFACPECGSEIGVRGIAPGRQVRCGFCRRLLEVPYLPRAADAPWKRRRFLRPKWVTWGWASLAVVAAVLLVTGSYRLLKRQYDSYQKRSINHLLDSSRRHEAGGQLGAALIDLDAALDLAAKAGTAVSSRLRAGQKYRPDLARRDAAEILDRLSRREPSSFALGEWLNLRARAAKDLDLQPLVSPIESQFQKANERQADFDLTSARRAFLSHDVGASLTQCDQIAALIPYLAPEIQPAVRRDAEALVNQLVSTHGVKVDAPQGHFIFGSASYVSDMLPVLAKALQDKGYLPNRPSSPWRELWEHALYHVRLDVSEQQEGNYLSSENRLSRIEATVTLSSTGGLIWQTKPTARSQVPLPKLPAYLASRAAISPERSEEFEQLLYKSARDQIDEKFSFSLGNMPACPSGATAGKP
jgi:hypothetical protein